MSGANGESDLVDRFAAAWTAGSDLEARTWLQLRQFALGALEPPDPPPAGRARPAAHDDFELTQAWFDAFSEELELPDRMQESHVRQQIDERMLWLWDDAAGETAALALRTPAATGVARVNCVYTPPERRGHGYAGAVTAACCADALARDAERVVLFTDLDNPAPNKVYQRIGFHPIADHRVVNSSPTRELAASAAAAVRLRRRAGPLPASAGPTLGGQRPRARRLPDQSSRRPEAAGALHVRTQRADPPRQLGVRGDDADALGPAVLQQRHDLVVGGVAPAAGRDHHLGVLGGRRLAAVEHDDHRLAGRVGEVVELCHQPPCGAGTVAPPAVRARPDHVGGVDDPRHRPIRSS